MTPTIHDVIALVRDRYGLTMAEALKIMKTPLHPLELRDQFAGQALAGVTGNPVTGCNSPGDFAHWAYRCADAMLKERIKNAEN
jgi:hypothetical protein